VERQYGRPCPACHLSSLKKLTPQRLTAFYMRAAPFRKSADGFIVRESCLAPATDQAMNSRLVLSDVQPCSLVREPPENSQPSLRSDDPF
jgi:hypothetical protein